MKMRNVMRLIVPLAAGVAVVGLTGCAGFRASTGDIDVDEKRHFDEKFDYSDLRKFTEKAAQDIANDELMGGHSEKPILMIAGVENRTTQYVDTKALTDRVRTLLFKTGEFRFVNATRRDDLLKEQGYQAANAPADAELKIGRQLGANYMLSGSLSEMKQKSPDQVRISRKRINYYNLTLEVTDLTTGELVWTDEQELAREASQPIIRW